MTKEELRDIITLNRRINSKLRQLERLEYLRQATGGIDYTKDRVQSSISDRTGELTIKIIDLQHEINDDTDELIDMQARAREAISKLEGKYNLIMELRYMECQEWRDVARLSHYSIDHTYKIHGQALLMLQDKSGQ